jgi:hypothetical protein
MKKVGDAPVFLKALRVFINTVCCNKHMDTTEMIVQGLMAELHAMICETWKRYTGFLVTNCICLVILCPWEEVAGNVVNKVCELLVLQTIHNYQIDI